MEIRCNETTNVFKSLTVLEEFFEEDKWKSVIQTIIPDYFKYKWFYYLVVQRFDVEEKWKSVTPTTMLKYFK